MLAGVEASKDGPSLFAGFARACGVCGREWTDLPRGRGAVFCGLLDSCALGKRRRATGSPAAFRVGGRRPYALAGELDWLLVRLAEKPDITLRALLAELRERGVDVSDYAVWHILAHAGIGFKKSLHAAASAGSNTRAGLMRSA